MKLESVVIEKKEIEGGIEFNLSGEDVGFVIGRRGETLDSLQYLTSLVANHSDNSYFKVTIDTGNYREKREKTLEILGRKLAFKAVKTGRKTNLEPMNPYERRIIHSALQKDKYVETHSEGEEPYRKVVITLKDGVDTGYENRGRYSRNRSYGKNNYRKPYNKKNAYNRDESVEETVSTDVEA